MAGDFAIRGADDFLKLSKALKEAGEKDLRKELHKGMRDAAKPLIPKARAAARARLPKAGGLAEKVAKAPMRVQVRTGRDAGVRIAVSKKAGIAARATNRGTFRHPVFGRDVWVTQSVPKGWFDEPLTSSRAEVLPDLERAIERVAQKAAGSI